MINKIIQGDCLQILKTFPDNFIDCCVSSPPYWGLRDYEVNGQMGHEETFEEFIENLCNIYDEIYRILSPSGTCFVNLGDTYSGSNRGFGDKNPKPKYKQSLRSRNIKLAKTDLPDKCLCMVPERFAIAMCERGWVLRNQIIWHKPNQLPSSVKDRFTVDFEKVFFFTKSKKYYFQQQFEPHKEKSLSQQKDRVVGHKAWDNDPFFGGRGADDKAVMKFNPSGRNKRTVWSVCTKAFSGAHFATFPEELIKPMIASGCPEGGIVLDPFMGAGTTAIVALQQKKNYIGIELKSEYIEIAEKRIKESTMQLRFL